MLTLKACASQGCDALTYIDTTGPYSEDNTGGYGTENGVESPADFTSYTLLVWAPDLDPETDPHTASINLLTDLPEPDSHGFYSWSLTPAMLGVTSIVDGVWYMEARGVTDTDEYTVAIDVILTANIREAIKAKMVKWKPGCGNCNKGCTDPGKLFMALTILCKGGSCSSAKSAEIIKWLQTAAKTCC